MSDALPFLREGNFHSLRSCGVAYLSPGVRGAGTEDRGVCPGEEGEGGTVGGRTGGGDLGGKSEEPAPPLLSPERGADADFGIF